tara:strand:+ start:253 stop:522 length:270 start_codon:yes stop_codon:yes gene_type:complete
MMWSTTVANVTLPFLWHSTHSGLLFKCIFRTTFQLRSYILRLSNASLDIGPLLKYLCFEQYLPSVSVLQLMLLQGVLLDFGIKNELRAK